MNIRYAISYGVLACVLLGSSGCKPAAPTAESATPGVAAKSSGAVGTPGAKGTGSDLGIVPMGGGAITPVTNPGAIEGSGSGVGQAAKGAAKAAADKAGQTPALPSTDSD